MSPEVNMPENRDDSGRFQPGYSGNPGGRPKGISKYVRTVTEGGIHIADFMTEIMRGNHGASLRDRMSAAIWLGERGFGKPRLSEESTVDDPMQEMLAAMVQHRVSIDQIPSRTD